MRIRRRPVCVEWSSTPLSRHQCKIMSTTDQTAALQTSLIRLCLSRVRQCRLLNAHKAQHLTRFAPGSSPSHCAIGRYLERLFSQNFPSHLGPADETQPIRQMLSVSANQVSRLAIKSAQVASVQNELLATLECKESCSFPPFSQNLSRWNLTPVGLSGR